MPLPALTNKEATLTQNWINTGQPVLTAASKHTTMLLAMGKSNIDAYMDKQSKTPQPKVSFAKTSKLKMNTNGYYYFATAGNTTGAAPVARSGMLATRTPDSAESYDGLKFRSEYVGINKDITQAQLDEFRAGDWAIDDPFPTAQGDAIMRTAFDNDADALWATGSNKAFTDGVLNSLVHIFSDGLTTAERGAVGPDESAYLNFAGYTRTASAVNHSSYISPQSGSPALTIEMIEAATDEIWNRCAGKVVVPMSPARFRALQTAYRAAYGRVMVDEDLAELGIKSSDTLQIGGNISVYKDFDCPASTFVLGFDLEGLYFGSEYDKTNLRLIDNPVTEQGYTLRGSYRRQIMHINPRAGFKITGLVSL